MAVPFNSMPGVLRVPFAYFEVNPGVPAYSGISRLLLQGRALPTGTLEPRKPRILGSGDPNAIAGKGSMLADMIAFARAHNPRGEIWVQDVGDPEGGQAATGHILFTGTATGSGEIVRYIGGERYAVAVAVGDGAAAIAAAFAAALGRGYVKHNRRMYAPVTAAVSGTLNRQVNLVARHVGTEGNGIRIEAGLDGDEAEVPGVTVAVTAMAGGSGSVDLGAALAALGKQAFDWIGSPYNSTGALDTVRDFLSDFSGRWSPTVDLDGHYITAVNGNLSALTTLGRARNDRHVSILGLLNYPQPLWSVVAAVAGRVAFQKNLGRSLTEAIEIALPMHGLVLSGIRPPKDLTDRWGGDDLQVLYDSGISALQVNNDGTVAINRVLTTYQTNASGSPDDTFLSISQIAVSAYVKRYMRLKVSSTYPQCVIKDENPTNIPKVVTTDQVRSTVIHAYTELANIAGIVDKPDLFAEYVEIERSSDASRMNAYIPIDVADEFIAFAANITVYREYNSATALN